MIITQTPLRVSFLGGGTDYPEYFSKYGGATLGSSINKYTYISVTPLAKFFNYRIRISYSKTELCNSLEEIQHPSVRECLRFMGIDGGIEIVVVNDLPARTGLGSSSSFTVGLLLALHAFKGEFVSQEKLAEEAVHVERDMIKERVGLQDQYICAMGGFLYLKFQEERKVSTTQLIIPPHRLKELRDHLMVFYTGQQRNAHDTLEQQMQRMEAGQIFLQLHKLHSLAQQGVEVLCNGYSLDNFGDLLHQAWMIKRELSDMVSNPFIDNAYERARCAGAIGGKLLGAGNGGFLLLYVKPYSQTDVRKALADIQEVSFHFENQGSRLIFYRP